jgi:hypothetical protein
MSRKTVFVMLEVNLRSGGWLLWDWWLGCSYPIPVLSFFSVPCDMEIPHKTAFEIMKVMLVLETMEVTSVLEAMEVALLLEIMEMTLLLEIMEVTLLHDIIVVPCNMGYSCHQGSK